MKRRRPGFPRASVHAVALVVLASAVAACGGSGSHVRKHAHAAKPRAATATTASSTPHTTSTRASTGPAPGSLPQTAQRPSATTSGFKSEMAALWRGVTANSVSAAMPAFFPLGAYLQVKAIADARGDWQSRLLGSFKLDIGAAHALLGAGAAGARLLSVNVPGAYAHWVPPGVCYNRVGYWEVPNSRMVYSEAGQTRSFGIASMISWRGVWYVVHFGAVLASGVVDAPSTGAGVSAPSSTC